MKESKECQTVGVGDGNEGNKRRPYKKPQMTSEKLIAFGAKCNGVASGGRKESTAAPNFCDTAKLLS